MNGERAPVGWRVWLWWVLASTVGWIVGWIVGGLVSGITDTAAGWAVLGAVYGAITGAVLVWLLRQRAADTDDAIIAST